MMWVARAKPGILTHPRYSLFKLLLHSALSMLLQAPPKTSYDLNFRCFGFPIRVSPWFWLGACFFGYGLTQSFDRMFEDASPGPLPLLLLWVGCMFLSILIHELGHALAYRRYGIESSIVLYHFGGLAIPGRSSDFSGRSASSLSPQQRMWVSFAGPLLQIASAIAITASFKLFGSGLSFAKDGMVYSSSLWPIDLIPGFTDGTPINSPGLYALLIFYLLPSFLWALLNLLPVWPLDGGQIAGSIVQLRGGPPTLPIQISLVTAIGIAVYAFSNGQTYLALMFAMLGFSSYQMLEQFRGRGY